ncbi:Uncharacterized protein HZ326_16403 [Fusarium oxysporum f. sp. albedinis]|nr:Uncharacterized protein HZ326_16403 [Fusarium oxysporum f. sp. albedinis]
MAECHVKFLLQPLAACRPARVPLSQFQPSFKANLADRLDHCIVTKKKKKKAPREPRVYVPGISTRGKPTIAFNLCSPKDTQLKDNGILWGTNSEQYQHRATSYHPLVPALSPRLSRRRGWT